MRQLTWVFSIVVLTACQAADVEGGDDEERGVTLSGTACNKNTCPSGLKFVRQ